MKIPLSVRRRWERAAEWVRTRRQFAHPGCGAVGCSACCRSDIVATRQEAELVAERLTPAQRADVLARGLPAPDSEVDPADPRFGELAVRELTRYGQRCALLTEDNRCSVYAVRPALCRTYMVATDPIECDPDRRGRAPETLKDLALREILPEAHHEDTGMLLDLLAVIVRREF